MKLRPLYPVLLVPLLGGLLVAAALQFHLLSPTHAASLSGRVVLPDDTPSYVSKNQLISRAASGQPITIAVGLNVRNESELASYIQQVTQPQSPLYHHYMSPATFTALYAPLSASESSVVAFLRSQGFTITTTYPNHLMVDASGTTVQAEQAFQVQINNYQTPGGLHFYANNTAPSLPGNIASLVSSVSGLDNIARYGRTPLTPGVAAQKFTHATSNAGVSCPQPGPAAAQTAYTPAQIATAYDFTGLYTAGNLGEGQTLGLLELDGFSPNDIALYTSCFGGKNTNIQTIPIDGYSGAAKSFSLEVELDMEMVLGLAPHLSSLRVYEGSINSIASYNDAWAHIVNEDIPVVSTSWIFCEQGPNMTNEIKQENMFFEAAAAQGQTILAASGDLGATGCYDPQKKINTFPAVDDPASQPYVTGVGGTTLHINSDNTYASEQVWNDRAIGNGASGGGVSHIWAMPRWQQGPGVANAYSTGDREVPDVAVNADPQTGYDVYCSVGGCTPINNGYWHVVGGTSAAAPVWAAMVALADEASFKAGGFPAGFMNPSLYGISHGVPGTSYASAFHDIVPVQGAINNNDYVGSSGTYPATSTYDLATGLGSFDAYNLTQNLITLGQSAATLSTPTSTTWYFAEGRVGASFQEFLTLENPDPSHTAQVQVQYLLENGTGPRVMHTVPPKSRVTVSANGDLYIPADSKNGQSLSMIVTSLNKVGIVAERPMYFSWQGAINSGTDVLGATQLGQNFYFADVESQRSYSSFITILNPPGNQSANVTVEYFAGKMLLSTKTTQLPAGQRGTMSPLDASQSPPLKGPAAVYVHSDRPVAVERPTYFTAVSRYIAGPVTGASSVVGASAPGTDWLFAEGYTGPNFQEKLVLANFDTSTSAPATATVKLEYANGQVNPLTISVPPMSQIAVDVNAESAKFAQATSDVSAEVTSDKPIVAERIEYFHFNGTISGGTDVMGMPGPAKTNYSFAEGYTTNGFSEFLTLQNPNTTAVNVAVTLYMKNGFSLLLPPVSVGPQTRKTLDLTSIMRAINQSSSSAGYEVSMSVQALGGGTIVAERPMYFNYHSTSQGGSDVVGYTG